jgi:hypothetical protein
LGRGKAGFQPMSPDLAVTDLALFLLCLTAILQHQREYVPTKSRKIIEQSIF